MTGEASNNALRLDKWLWFARFVKTSDDGKKVLKNALALARRAGIDAQSAIYETMGMGVADVLVGEAKKWKADLIVMGSHRHSMLQKILSEDTAAYILKHSTIPLLIIPTREK